ncbi:MAG: tRNA (N6-isopentenyl adenosine(37)-C2)-methylthiotransferase MiaB [Myxococcota bacterium]
MPRRYLVQTFGCQMNVHDSRRIEEVLEADGYVPAEEPALADVIVVNTCSVREKAEHKLMSLLGRYRPLKEERPKLLLAVAGCVAQQEGERLLERANHVDVVIGPDNIPELSALLRDADGGAPPVARTVFDDDAPEFLVATPRRPVEGVARPEVTAFVTTMKGCDERCTYCIVPYTRGSERYRPAAEMVAEVKSLVAGGVREITLLGQTVNSWSDPSEAKDRRADSRFAELLYRIADDVPDLARLRYTSPHPRHVTSALVLAHRELDVLPAHVHLPVQSGSDRLLKRMLRRYSREEYIERARLLLGARPGFTLSTDIIVGFPGETDEDFELTLSLVREVGFVAAFGFKYSPRPYTPALRLGDDVPEAVKSERLQRLFEVVEAQQGRHLAGLVGTRTRVLVEGPSRSGKGRFSGRSARHEIVHFDADGFDPTGAILEVEIVEAHRHSLLGVLVPGSADRPLEPRKVRPTSPPASPVRLPIAR